MSCIFCDAFIEDGQPTVVLRQKGCDAINAITFTVIPGQNRTYSVSARLLQTKRT
ncbi:hypothetical protein DPMN_019515 [Dreissena polymorpha]|uniref:Uncharacterized protein n=1 Tax=Dreissena polymorpha TaxID=45954 RepID=A0A9D4NF68_DREPO|nr:hypothetical protein DPMN_019515 [Dreissena polymorpha]